MRLVLILAVLLMASGTVSASERVDVCAKYRSGYGWSKGYQVSATKIKGGDLNRATRSWDYDAYATYIVIFWDRDQASIIKLDWPNLSAIGTQGEDQRGVRWEVSTSSYCF